jgi:hypothetical protein
VGTPDFQKIGKKIGQGGQSPMRRRDMRRPVVQRPWLTRGYTTAHANTVRCHELSVHLILKACVLHAFRKLCTRLVAQPWWGIPKRPNRRHQKPCPTVSTHHLTNHPGCRVPNPTALDRANETFLSSLVIRARAPSIPHDEGTSPNDTHGVRENEFQARPWRPKQTHAARHTRAAASPHLSIICDAYK